MNKNTNPEKNKTIEIELQILSLNFVFFSRIVFVGKIKNNNSSEFETNQINPLNIMKIAKILKYLNQNFSFPNIIIINTPIKISIELYRICIFFVFFIS